MSQIHHTWGRAHLFPPKANFCQLPHLHQRYHHFLTTQFLNPESFLTVPSPCQLPHSINPTFANSLKSAPPNPLLLYHCRLLSPLSGIFNTFRASSSPFLPFNTLYALVGNINFPKLFCYKYHFCSKLFSYIPLHYRIKFIWLILAFNSLQYLFYACCYSHTNPLHKFSSPAKVIFQLLPR